MRSAEGEKNLREHSGGKGRKREGKEGKREESNLDILIVASNHHLPRQKGKEEIKKR